MNNSINLEKQPTFVNGSTNYECFTFKAKGNGWSIVIASGQFNYASIVKVTNNPHGLKTGKQFDNLDQMQAGYKCADIKTAILLIQSGLF